MSCKRVTDKALNRTSIKHNEQACVIFILKVKHESRYFMTFMLKTDWRLDLVLGVQDRLDIVCHLGECLLPTTGTV